MPWAHPECNIPCCALARPAPTRVQVGSTIFHTLAGMLVLLLASPIYDGLRLYYSTKDKPEQAALDLRCCCLPLLPLLS